eukprot:10192274-Lingulodinium_polyedra.AAC.1
MTPPAFLKPVSGSATAQRSRAVRAMPRRCKPQHSGGSPPVQSPLAPISHGVYRVGGRGMTLPA